MSYGYWKSKADCLQASLILLFTSVCFGLLLWGLIFFAVQDDYVRKKCSDTNCTVKIIDGICFARISELDTSPFSRVECDKKRKGNHNLTLPCNVDENGNCVIKCVRENHKKSAGVIPFGIFMGLTVVLLIFIIIYFLINLDEYITALRDSQTDDTSDDDFISRYEKKSKTKVSSNSTNDTPQVELEDMKKH